MKKQAQEDNLKNWLLFAKENILFAKLGMKEDMPLYHSICFMCQASSEKYLKAYLISKNWVLRKTHDLSELLNFCSEYDESFQELFPSCEILNEYITESRYPGDLPFESITKADAHEAIKAAEVIEKYVLGKI